MLLGRLVSHTEKRGYLQEEQAHPIFTKMVCTINYCHESSLPHRDIKPDNSLQDGKGSVRLCDFGLLIKITSGQKFKNGGDIVCVVVIPDTLHLGDREGLFCWICS